MVTPSQAIAGELQHYDKGQSERYHQGLTEHTILTGGREKMNGYEFLVLIAGVVGLVLVSWIIHRISEYYFWK